MKVALVHGAVMRAYLERIANLNDLKPSSTRLATINKNEKLLGRQYEALVHDMT
jgi:hypothetical protein